MRAHGTLFLLGIVLHDQGGIKNCATVDQLMVASNAIFTNRLPINGFIAKLRTCEGDLQHHNLRWSINNYTNQGYCGWTNFALVYQKYQKIYFY